MSEIEKWIEALDCVIPDLHDANYDHLVPHLTSLREQLIALRSFAGVQVLLQSILDEAYPPNTIVCSDKEGADTGAQLTAAARKILEQGERISELEQRLRDI